MPGSSHDEAGVRRRRRCFSLSTFHSTNEPRAIDLPRRRHTDYVDGHEIVYRE
jgi:hypothetical protein